MHYKFIILFVVFSLLVLIKPLYALPNTQSLLATSTTNPTGTFTSGMKILEGYSRMKGLIVINSDAGNTPVARVNQAVDASSAIVETWHSTDTVSFTRSGSIWKGEIDVSIFGGYGYLTIGNFGTATFNKVNWYASIETAVYTSINVVGTVTATTPTVSSVTHNIITVGTVSVVLIGTNTTRHNVLIVNEGSTNTCRYMLASTATVGSGTILYTSGGSYEPDFKNAIYTGAISAITQTGTTAVSVLEF